MKRITAVMTAFLLMICMSSCVFQGRKNGDSESTVQSITDQTSYETETDTAGSGTVSSDTAAAPEITTVSFIGAGDNIVYYGNVRDAMSNAVDGGQKYNFLPAYSDIAPMIEGADIAFINQETLMCGEGYDFSYYPRFNGPQDMGFNLVELGFDVINIANNHMLDKGPKGLLNTIDFWESQPVSLIGGYKNENDFYRICIYEEQGIEVAFLAYTYGTNDLKLPKGSEIIIPYIDEDVMREQIAVAKDLSDVVIVSVHWGVENTFVPSESQEYYAQLMADCGVDVIIGHHPHVIQPVKWIKGSNGHKTLCVYSLGNLMAEMANDYNMVGGLISFNIVKEGNRDIQIEDAVFIPTVFHFDSRFYGNHIYLMKDYTEELASEHGISYYKKYTTLSRLKGYVSKTIDEEFLPDYFK